MRILIPLLLGLVLYAAAATVNIEKVEGSSNTKDADVAGRDTESFADSAVVLSASPDLVVNGDQGKEGELQHHREKRGAIRRRLRKQRDNLRRRLWEKDCYLKIARLKKNFYLEQVKVLNSTTTSTSTTTTTTVAPRP
ncbi:hypothetical protein GCK32_018683 [Trichostrongylus colubriformis]|uniref:Uncharacterized protein n=1 Tax=Trichostrongylus colubriformis TaxID=6319 RepID=A0AAN8IYM2_TRICO